MFNVRYSAVFGFLCLQSAALAGAATPVLKPGSVTIGANLQTYTRVALSEPATADLQLTLTSADPSKLLLAKLPNAEGSASITLTVRQRFRTSPEYWLQALAGSGEVSYTVSAPGLETATGSATLTPSGILIAGPHGIRATEFSTTPRAWPPKITLRVARLNPSLEPVQQQYLRGGLNLDLKIASSNPAAGTAESQVSIPAATVDGTTRFRAGALGTTKLSITQPPGFSTPATANFVNAIVKAPGLAAGSDMIIGENLQTGAALSLGEPAPEGGVDVTVASSRPEKLLLSKSPTEKGSGTITVHMPAGAVSTTYYLQALASEGTVTNTASAPGYVTRVGTIKFAPSGVILSLVTHAAPDRAEVERPEKAGTKQNIFVALLSEHKDTPLALYTAFMDPVSRRAADITVQPLRAGLKAKVKLKNADPAVGTVDEQVTIEGGTHRTVVPFKPLKPGQTVIAIDTPEGFATPSNYTELLAIVRE